MYRQMIVSGVISLGALLGPKIASATPYTVNCGANGPASVVQSQIDAIGSAPGNTITVTGTCVGSVTVTRADSLTVSNLSLSQAHLYFDEQNNGPAASSALAGPVCVTGTSSVDTDNSSTVITATTTCP